MRLHRLAITAFGPFGAVQEIDFDTLSGEGIFLLHGPTGAGKTSVLDAVCYALYGAVPGVRQSPAVSLRSSHAPEDTPTEVVLELTVGGRRLEITRRPARTRPKKNGRGHTTERAQSLLREYDSASGTWNGLSRSHQEIGEELSQLLGMSREQFCQVVLLPQGEFAAFLRADAEARARLLGRLFDTGRFAAVEEHLADRRRAAEQRVRTGDERLLAVAHRIEQAAGPAADDWPPPAQQAGDPGLAGAVLAWAAVARSGAAERLTVACQALAAAERRHGATRLALDTAGELHRLQRRHEDAVRRRDALDAGEPAHRERAARLDRGERAGRVAPALRLRQDAEEEHLAARADRDRIRAGLPADLAGAGAEQLTERVEGIRRELGALESARRAEERVTEIARERAALDRETRADDELLAEAAAWLDGWDALRHGHRERVTAAQDAAMRAEQLAARLEPARRRLRAARDRDRLVPLAARAEDHLRDARDRAGTAREHWLGLKEERLRGMAAELADALTPGEPCAVCGSAEHPAPARAAAGRVTADAEDGAYEEVTRAEAARTEAERELTALRTALGAARREAAESAETAGPAPHDTDGATGSPDEPAPGRAADLDDPGGTEALRSLVAELERDHHDAHALAGDAHAAREALDRAEREHTDRLDAHGRAGRRTAARISAREALDREQAAREAELERARGGEATVAAHAAALESLAALLGGAAEAVRVCERTARALKDADGRLADAAYRAGFSTPGEAAGAVLGEAEHRALRERVDARLAEEAAVADRFAEADALAAAADPPADPAAAAIAHDAAGRALRASASAADAARERCAELVRLSAEAAAETRGLGPLRAEYERVAGLATLTAGTSAANERRMRLESYVLAARLEQVAAAATVRLRRMSAGRYTLVHSDVRSGNRRSGLGLHVVDAWTGSERDTATLSGGETFFASLALALGLADVVTDEAGGVRLDTLFIDEGFGSLDEQTLDEVLDVLDSLRERDRSVGIVSHVADLRRRIPTQLEVVKERRGSAVRLRTAPLGG
jgi:DNA repair protein SbcC/Rad50